MPSAIALESTPGLRSPNTAIQQATLKVLSRNIDKVVLGDLQFETWFYSPYPDILILGPDYHPPSSSVAAVRHVIEGKNGHNEGPETPSNSGTSTNNGVVKTESSIPACATLHVCPYCFRYTPNLKDYTVHLHLHIDTSRQAAQSNKIFLPVPESATKVYEWEGYTVWDVDGEVEKLYCQNLSLFGKLFLEQKSVFFDTSGFHYFVLTYTTPESEIVATKPDSKERSKKRRSNSSSEVKNDAKEADEIDTVGTRLRTQTMGFFSKENLSWDSNNLACILVFPPYQHRNLGQLLMAVSYKLSGWEWEDSIIGGPEKPLSAMGRKSYLRFWTERISRFIMGQSWDADGRIVFEGANGRKRKKNAVSFRKEEMTVREIGERTGMLPEDVIAALNEMNVCDVVPPKRKKNQTSDGSDQQSVAADGDHGLSMTVLRSRVSEWVRIKGINLVSPVKEEGFLGEWALSDTASVGSEEDQTTSENG